MKTAEEKKQYRREQYLKNKDKEKAAREIYYSKNKESILARNKKYNKIIDKVNKETLIDSKKIKELETSLSNINSKSCNYEKFKLYCIEKNKINNKLYTHYEKSFFRKFKLVVFSLFQYIKLILLFVLH